MTAPGTINSAGLFTAGTSAGTWGTAIQATCDGVNGYAGVTVTSSSEPVYTAGTNTLVWDDSARVDAAASMADVTGYSGSGYTWYPIFGADPNITLGAGGWDGSGNYIRQTYAGTYQESHSIDMVVGSSHAYPPVISVPTYFSVYKRMTLGGASGPSLSPVAMKWIMLWHTNGTRCEFDTHDHLPNPGNYPSPYTFGWQVYDQGQTTQQGDQPIGPYPGDKWDGAWHRFTYAFKPNTTGGSPSSRDGYARMWVDGTKIIDISAATIGVTPPGGSWAWCLGDDVDNIATLGIQFVRWVGPLTTAYTGGFTVDWDRFQWWY